MRDASEEEAHGKFEDQLKLSSLASPSSRLSVHSRLRALALLQLITKRIRHFAQLDQLC